MAVLAALTTTASLDTAMNTYSDGAITAVAPVAQHGLCDVEAYYH